MTETIESKKELLGRASKAYYEGDPIISDERFDALEAEVQAETGEVPEVAAGYIPDSRKVEHARPMLSLAKAHSHDEVLEWVNRARKEVGGTSKVAVEPKWDGIAAEVIVLDGLVRQASTRGNGLIGEDITETVRIIPDIDLLLDQDGVHYVEIVMNKSKLKFINDTYKMDFSNTRNATAGIVRRLDRVGEELSAHLSAMNHGGTKYTSHHDLSDESGIIAALNAIESSRGDMECDIDGVVIKVVDQDLREQMGATRHSPRWAVAYKFPAESATTVLREVSWSRGRTGRITPVAHFDPVLLVGASISNATLHNEDFVKDLNLHIGDTIRVRRSGDVIPYIEGVVESNPSGEKVVQPDMSDMDDTEARSLVVSQVHYALQALDADGIGYSTIYGLHERGVISGSDVVEVLDSLLSLKPGSIRNLWGMGERSEEKFLYAVNSIRECYQGTWLAALGVPSLGFAASQELEQAFGTIKAISDASYEDIIKVPGFGPTRTQAVVDAQPIMKRLIAVLDEHGIDPPLREYDEVPVDSEWSGKNIVITGSFDGYSRGDIADLLTALGANIQGSVSGKTDILIAGKRAGSKLTRARELSVEVIEDFDPSSVR